MESNTCVILLVKYPQKGKVKARLAKQINEDLAIELYKNFVLDMLTMLNNSKIPYIIGYKPRRTIKRFKKWLDFDLKYLAQRGADLGQVLKNIFTDAYSLGFENVIVLSSDCPDLPFEMLNEAIAALKDNRAVIGPSIDGGYNMIGFSKKDFSNKTFEKITWSTKKVFQETISKLKNQGQSIHILPKWGDVDNFNDLKNLFHRNQNSKFNSSKTMKLLYLKSELWFDKQPDKEQPDQ